MLSTQLTSYRHYKGGTYTLLYVARLSEERDTQVAVYVSHATRAVWVRPLSMFLEDVLWPDGQRRPRFTAIDVDAGVGYREPDPLPLGG